jgi:hypothetical protein
MIYFFVLLVYMRKLLTLFNYIIREKQREKGKVVFSSYFYFTRMTKLRFYAYRIHQNEAQRNPCN